MATVSYTEQLSETVHGEDLGAEGGTKTASLKPDLLFAASEALVSKSSFANHDSCYAQVSSMLILVGRTIR